MLDPSGETQTCKENSPTAKHVRLIEVGGCVMIVLFCLRAPQLGSAYFGQHSLGVMDVVSAILNYMVATGVCSSLARNHELTKRPLHSRAIGTVLMVGGTLTMVVEFYGVSHVLRLIGDMYGTLRYEDHTIRWPLLLEALRDACGVVSFFCGWMVTGIGTRIRIPLAGASWGQGSADFSTEDPNQGPVVYLRPFRLGMMVVAQDGKVTGLEGLVEDLFCWHRVVTLGEPTDSIPNGLIPRYYETNDNWQQRVITLVQESSLTVIVLGDTGALRWELNHCLSTLAPKRFLAIVPLQTDQKPRDAIVLINALLPKPVEYQIDELESYFTLPFFYNVSGQVVEEEEFDIFDLVIGAMCRLLGFGGKTAREKSDARIALIRFEPNWQPELLKIHYLPYTNVEPDWTRILEPLCERLRVKK